jgi:phosphoribosyl-AMP cyclohydrolase
LPTGTLPDAPVTLTFEETEKVFDPLAVYGDAPNPTKL